MVEPNDQRTKIMSACAQPLRRLSDQLQAGDVLGNYQLLCPIARGGMGQIWAARRTASFGLPKLVAIKTALPHPKRAPGVLQQLLFDEAQVAASIRHPNVCHVCDLGESDGVFYLAMEWVEGASLHTLLSSLHPPRRLDGRIAAYIVAQACTGLHAAHELKDRDGVLLGVVHRDATPQNILLSTSGEVKVADFGVVKSRGQAHEATMTGELKGKVSYLAPEQLLAKPIDRRADIFALGCVLYYATTGQRPFRGNSLGETLLRITEGEFLRPCALFADYPLALEAIVLRALAHDAKDRFRTAAEMAVALEAYLLQSGPPVGREAVAQALRQSLGRAIECLRHQVLAAQAAFESQSGEHRITRPSAVSDPPHSDAVPSIPVLRDSPPSSTPAPVVGPLLTSRIQELSPPSARPPLRSSRWRRWAWGSVAFPFAALVSVLWPGPTHRTVEMARPAAVRAVMDPATPAAPSLAALESSDDPSIELMTINLRGTPRGAFLSIDGGQPVTFPCTLVVPRDQRTHLLRLWAPRYSELERTVRFDHGYTLTLDLAPAPSRVTKRKLPRPTRASETNSSPPNAVNGQATRTPAEAASQAPRSIDQSNPFRG